MHWGCGKKAKISIKHKSDKEEVLGFFDGHLASG